MENINLTKLNIGCGRDILKKLPKPWLNVDVAGGSADFKCDIRHLPKEWTNRFDEVRASHVLEHFFMDEFNAIITEWVRVLKPGGQLRLIVPDLDIIINALVCGKDSKTRSVVSINETTPIMTQIFGFGYWSRNTESEWRHRFIFNKKLLKQLLVRQKSFEKILTYKKEKDPTALFGIKDDSQNSFSLLIKAKKKFNQG